MKDLSSNRIYKHDYSEASPNTSALKFVAEAPPWRRFSGDGKSPPLEPDEPRAMDERQAKRGRDYIADAEEAQIVDVCLALRRPLLVTGAAGLGKTSLAYSVAWQLGLGNVLRWGITSRSTLKDALYHYDALARLHDVSLNKNNPDNLSQTSIGDYLTLGPLGTALLPTESKGYLPRVLLIDEIDKGDADLPSDLLHVLEEGFFEIPEIERLPDEHKRNPILVKTSDGLGERVEVPKTGCIRCTDFPLIIMTSNGDREFPPAFLRRCLPLEISWKRRVDQISRIVKQHLGASEDDEIETIIKEFVEMRSRVECNLSIDQLLNALFLVKSSADVNPAKFAFIKKSVLHSLNEPIVTFGE